MKIAVALVVVLALWQSVDAQVCVATGKFIFITLLYYSNTYVYKYINNFSIGPPCDQLIEYGDCCKGTNLGGADMVLCTTLCTILTNVLCPPPQLR